MKDKTFPIIGIVHFRKRKGCRRATIRVKSDGEVYVTVPFLVPMVAAEDLVTMNLNAIKKMQERMAEARKTRQCITESVRHFTHYHNLVIKKGVDNSLRLSCTADDIIAIVPGDVDITNDFLQEKLCDYITGILRAEAKDFLPKRVAELAAQHGFECSGVRISRARTNWGSCSSEKALSLSLYLMTLPYHLIDFVILHELCHTVHMDHGTEFHALLDRVSGGKRKEYKEKLDRCATDIFPKFREDEE